MKPLIIVISMLMFGKISHAQENIGALLNGSGFASRMAFPPKVPRNLLSNSEMLKISTTTAAQVEAGNNSKENKKDMLTLYPAQIIYPEGTKLNPLEIFPNPATNQVAIRLEGKDRQGYTLELYNNQGTRLLQQAYSGKPLDVSKLAAGIYLIHLRKGKKVYMQKLVVSK